jgi:hypothetical protein
MDPSGDKWSGKVNDIWDLLDSMDPDDKDTALTALILECACSDADDLADAHTYVEELFDHAKSRVNMAWRERVLKKVV